MSEPDCAFYAAEMVLGLEELHSLMIVYRYARCVRECLFVVMEQSSTALH